MVAFACGCLRVVVSAVLSSCSSFHFFRSHRNSPRFSCFLPLLCVVLATSPFHRDSIYKERPTLARPAAGCVLVRETPFRVVRGIS